MKDNIFCLFFLFFELLSIITRGMLRPCWVILVEKLKFFVDESAHTLELTAHYFNASLNWD